MTKMNEWMNERLTTPQHKKQSAIGCQNKVDGAYKRSLAVNWKEFPHEVVAVGFLSRYLSDPYHISDAI